MKKILISSVLLGLFVLFGSNIVAQVSKDLALKIDADTNTNLIS